MDALASVVPQATILRPDSRILDSDQPSGSVFFRKGVGYPTARNRSESLGFPQSCRSQEPARLSLPKYPGALFPLDSTQLAVAYAFWTTVDSLEDTLQSLDP